MWVLADDSTCSKRVTGDEIRPIDMFGAPGLPTALPGAKKLSPLSSLSFAAMKSKLRPPPRNSDLDAFADGGRRAGTGSL